MRYLAIITLLTLSACGHVELAHIGPRFECVCNSPDEIDGLGNHDVIGFRLGFAFGSAASMSTIEPADVSDSDD